MIRLSKALLIATVSFGTAGTALAQDAKPDEPPAAKPPEGEPKPASTTPSLTLAKGKILIAGSTMNISLGDNTVFKPVSLAPAVYYGAQDKLTIGITHDGGTTPWSPRPAILSLSGTDLMGNTITVTGGGGICITGSDNGCGKVYNNIGLDALYSLKQEKLSLAAHPALDISSFDPFAVSLRLGALGRYVVNDKMSLVFDPRISFGLTERDSNKDYLDLPFWGWYAVQPKLDAYVSTGIAAPFDGFGDFYRIPLQFGANYMVNEKLTVGGDFSFTNLIGSNGGLEGRALGLRVIYAL